MKTFLAERIEEVISGETAPLVVKVYGNDLEAIDDKAHEIQVILEKMNAAAEITAPPGEPQIVVRLRPAQLKQYGFRPVDVLEAVQTAYQGATVAQTYDDNRVFDVVVVLEPVKRRDPEGVASLLLRGADGARVRLGEIADVFTTTGRHEIRHDGTQRYQAVTCTPKTRDLRAFAAEAQKRINAEVKFPKGVYAAWSGAAEQQAKATREILLHSGLAGAGILLLLAVVFGTVRNLALILVNLPFALVGGVLAVAASGGSLSIGSLVGFVTLFGITMRNSIMMISHFHHLVVVEGQPWGLETALRGASERLVPILMTALVTALGLLPLALESGKPGREIEGPMAIVILGGLATSTLLNLLVLPSLALKFGKFDQ